MLESELNALAGLLQMNHFWNAIKQAKQHGRCQPFQPQQPDTSGVVLIKAGFVTLVRVNVKGPNMQAGPARHGGRAKQKPGDGGRLASQPCGAFPTANIALFGIQFRTDGVVLGIQLNAVVTVHGTDTQRPLDQRIGPTPIHVEPANRLLRQQLGICHQIGKRNPVEQPQAHQPVTQFRRHRGALINLELSERSPRGFFQFDAQILENVLVLVNHDSSSSVASLGRSRRITSRLSVRFFRTRRSVTGNAGPVRCSLINSLDSVLDTRSTRSRSRSVARVSRRSTRPSSRVSNASLGTSTPCKPSKILAKSPANRVGLSPNP